MKPLAKATGDVLDALTAGLEIGEARKVGNGPYMPVHVDRLSHATYSLAHYFQQNGDLVCDPDGVFLRTAQGWLPVSLQLCTGAYTRALELDDGDKPCKWNPAAYRELSSFAAMWLRNIKEQQGGLVAIVAAANQAA
jgi:hypothetical protein